MKSRVLVVVLMFVLVMSLFTGCKSIEYPNVNFFGVADSFKSDGWRPFVMIKVYDTRLATISFDAVNIDATTSMFEAIKAGKDKDYNIDLAYANQLKLCAQALIEKQDPAAFVFDENGVTTQIKGVTVPVKEYFDLAKKAIAEGANNRAQFPNDQILTETATAFDKDGWKRTMTIYAKGGIAIAANFDAINKAGESRNKLNVDTDWIAQNKLIEDFFLFDKVNEQKFFSKLVTLLPDGTTGSIPGVTMKVKDIYDLVVKSILSATLR